jgi:hypothetical protein
MLAPAPLLATRARVFREGCRAPKLHELETLG